jgi:polysaccharide export outer membrane protein
MAALAGLIPKGVRRLIGSKFVTACAFAFAGYRLLAAQNSLPLSQHAGVVPEATLVSVSASASHEYVINPDDVLSISMYDAPEITGDYRVSPSGEIELPLLSSPILAAGQTPDQLSELVSDKYRESEIVSHPRVTVAIKESRVHAITISGAVKKPQMYPVFGKTTLLDVLSQAEGLADDAGSLALVSRGTISLQAIGQSEILGATGKPSSSASSFSVNLSHLMATGDPDLNVDL